MSRVRSQTHSSDSAHGYRATTAGHAQTHAGRDTKTHTGQALVEADPRVPCNTAPRRQSGGALPAKRPEAPAHPALRMARVRTFGKGGSRSAGARDLSRRDRRCSRCRRTSLARGADAQRRDPCARNVARRSRDRKRACQQIERLADLRAFKNQLVVPGGSVRLPTALQIAGLADLRRMRARYRVPECSRGIGGSGAKAVPITAIGDRATPGDLQEWLRIRTYRLPAPCCAIVNT